MPRAELTRDEFGSASLRLFDHEPAVPLALLPDMPLSDEERATFGAALWNIAPDRRVAAEYFELIVQLVLQAAAAPDSRLVRIENEAVRGCRGGNGILPWKAADPEVIRARIQRTFPAGKAARLVVHVDRDNVSVVWNRGDTYVDVKGDDAWWLKFLPDGDSVEARKLYEAMWNGISKGGRPRHHKTVLRMVAHDFEAMQNWVAGELAVSVASRPEVANLMFQFLLPSKFEKSADRLRVLTGVLQIQRDFLRSRDVSIELRGMTSGRIPGWLGSLFYFNTEPPKANGAWPLPDVAFLALSSLQPNRRPMPYEVIRVPRMPPDAYYHRSAVKVMLEDFDELWRSSKPLVVAPSERPSGG